MKHLKTIFVNPFSRVSFKIIMPSLLFRLTYCAFLSNFQNQKYLKANRYEINIYIYIYNFSCFPCLLRGYVFRPFPLMSLLFSALKSPTRRAIHYRACSALKSHCHPWKEYACPWKSFPFPVSDVLNR